MQVKALQWVKAVFLWSLTRDPWQRMFDLSFPDPLCPWLVIIPLWALVLIELLFFISLVLYVVVRNVVVYLLLTRYRRLNKYYISLKVLTHDLITCFWGIDTTTFLCPFELFLNEKRASLALFLSFVVTIPIVLFLRSSTFLSFLLLIGQTFLYLECINFNSCY